MNVVCMVVDKNTPFVSMPHIGALCLSYSLCS